MLFPRATKDYLQNKLFIPELKIKFQRTQAEHKPADRSNLASSWNWPFWVSWNPSLSYTSGPCSGELCFPPVENRVWLKYFRVSSLLGPHKSQVGRAKILCTFWKFKFMAFSSRVKFWWWVRGTDGFMSWGMGMGMGGVMELPGPSWKETGPFPWGPAQRPWSQTSGGIPGQY